MMDRGFNHKFLYTTLIAIIAALCGELYLLTEKLSDMSEAIQTLNDKVSELQDLQEIQIEKETKVEKGNHTIAGICAIISLMVVLYLYFGGIDPGSMGDLFNISANQASQDIISQNQLICQNLSDCLRSIDLLNKSAISELGHKTDVICGKINVVINAVVKSDCVNQMLSSISSKPEDFE